MGAPAGTGLSPAAEWNTGVLTWTGPTVLIKMNGRPVQGVDQSKIEEITAQPLCGSVCLQNHGSPAIFRNVQMQITTAAE